MNNHNPELIPRGDEKLPLSRLALNLITVGTAHPLADVLSACARYGIRTISPWQEHYAGPGVSQAARLIRDHDISVNTVCRMTGFGAAITSAQWQAALDGARQIIDEAAELRAASITVVGGGIGADGDLTGARERIVTGVAEVLDHARAAGVTLALEALHPMVAAERGVINTVAQAVRYARRLGDGASVMIDAYNSWWDPELGESIKNASGLIGGYQVSDWRVPTDSLVFDRTIPGDGIIDLKSIRRQVELAGYQTTVEIEILSSRLSSQPLDELLPAVIAGFENHC